MTGADYLYCVLNELLDYESELESLCPSCREQAEQRRCPGCGALTDDVNPQFDNDRFEGLKT